MKKIFFVVGFILCFLSVFSQPEIKRAGAANTVVDARLGAQYNFFLPRYIDTTNANLSKGIDSCGALIYTYDVNTIWVRTCNPKKWVEVGSGGGGSLTLQDVTDNGNTTTNQITTDTITTTGIKMTGNSLTSRLLPNGLLGGIYRLPGGSTLGGYLVASVNGQTANVAGNALIFTGDIPESGSSFYFTNARARSAISLTTNGTSGAATYNSTTGVFNIPDYSAETIIPPMVTHSNEFYSADVDNWNYGGNMRNEEGTILSENPFNPNCDTLIMFYTKYREEPGDVTLADIAWKRTYDGGRTWTDSGFHYVGNGRNYWASAFQSLSKDTQFVTWVNLQPNPDELLVTYRLWNGTGWGSWSSPSVGYQYSHEPVNRNNTVVADWHRGYGYLMGNSLEISGSNSVNGVRDGLLLYSVDGITWDDPIGANIDVPDSSCIEAYVVIDNEGTGYKFFWRTARSDSVMFYDIADDFSSYGPNVRFSGLTSPNSCHHMIYDTTSQQYFWAGNRTDKEITYSIVDGNDRLYIDLYSSRNLAEKRWDRVMNVAQFRNKYVIQPTISIIGQRMIVNYSTGEDIVGGFPYSLKCISFPVSMAYSRDQGLYSSTTLIVKSTPTWYWETSRPYTHAHFGWNTRSIEDGGFKLTSEHGFPIRTAIQFDWKADSTSLGWKWFIQKWNDAYFQPSIQWNFKIRGYNVGAGFNYPNYEVFHSYIRHANTIDTTTQIFADGRIETIGRIMPGTATTSQINAFLAPTRKAGQIIWNSDSTRLGVYTGSAWKYLAWTTDVGSSGISLSDLSATSPITYNNSTGEFSTSMTSGKLIGRSTAGTGVMEEISIGDGLSLSGGTLSAVDEDAVELLDTIMVSPMPEIEIDLSGYSTTAYGSLKIDFSGLTNASGNIDYYFTVKRSGQGSYDGSNAYYRETLGNVGDFGTLCFGMQRARGTIILEEWGENIEQAIYVSSWGQASGTTGASSRGVTIMQNAGAITHIKLSNQFGVNFTGGLIRIYGYRK